MPKTLFRSATDTLLFCFSGIGEAVTGKSEFSDRRSITRGLQNWTLCTTKHCPTRYGRPPRRRPFRPSGVLLLRLRRLTLQVLARLAAWILRWRAHQRPISPREHGRRAASAPQVQSPRNLRPVQHLPASAAPSSGSNSAKKRSDVESPRKPNHDTQRHLPPRARINTSPSRTWNRIAPVRPSHRRPRSSGTESCMCTRTTRAGSRCATMRRAFQRATHMTSMCALVSETWYGQTVLGFTSNGCRQRSLRAARARCRTGSDHSRCPRACSPGPQARGLQAAPTLKAAPKY